MQPRYGMAYKQPNLFGPVDGVMLVIIIIIVIYQSSRYLQMIQLYITL